MTLPDRTTLLVMLSAFILALLCVLPATHATFPFWVIAAGGHIADTLFHELGHTLFYWLFGHAAIPMIFTLFGADQAGGMSMDFGHSWLVQAATLAALAYTILRARGTRFFIPACAFTAAILLVLLTGHEELVIAYMGHGGSIAMGGFFLFRALIYLDARNGFERWLNAFFGFFLIVSNFAFSYGLAFDPYASMDYSEHVAFGVTHNDFMAMSLIAHGLSVKGVALFTMCYCVATVIAAYILSLLCGDAFYAETDITP